MEGSVWTVIKKIVSCLLLVCMLIPYNLGFQSFAVTNDKNNYDNIMNRDSSYNENSVLYETIKDELPALAKEYITVTLGGHESTLYLNAELWKDKELVVYGSYEMVGGNDFKNATRVDEVEKPNQGYYKKNSKRGEYRYHGYTLSGSPYINSNFPRDFKNAPAKEELKYMFEFWNNPVLSAKNRKTDFTKSAYEKPDSHATVTQTLGYQIRNSTTEKAPDSEGVYNTWEHLNIQSPSSTSYNGEGKIYHDYNGRIRYRSMSLDVATVKAQTPTSTTIEILNKGNNQFQDGKANIEVEVTAIIHDKAIANEPTKNFYQYYREDIERASFVITGKNYTNSFFLDNLDKSHGVYVDGDYGIRDTITIPVDASMLNQGILELTANTFFEYTSKPSVVPSPTTTDNDSDQVSGEGLIALYNVEDIKLKPTDVFTVDQVKYRDSSFGKINHYEFKIKRDSESGYTSIYSGTNKDEINTKLYDYLKPIVAEEQLSDPSWFEQFRTQQIVRDVYGETDQAYKNFIVGAMSLEVIDMEVNMPINAFDIVAYKPSYEIKSGSPSSVKVEVDGIDVDFDYFFNGNFQFNTILGDVGRNNKIVKCRVSFMSEDDVESYWEEWVKVYSTKPTTQLTVNGKTKQNRKIEVRNDSESVNNAYLWTHYPITGYEWTYQTLDGDSGSLQFKDLGDLGKDLQYKKEGFYQVSLVGTNDLGRRSDPYELQIYIMPDRPANVIFNIWNNVLTRNEELLTTLDIASLDGDIVTNEKITLYKDTDKDGVFETLVEEMTREEFLVYVPSELDDYRAIYTCDETFGEPTITEFLDGTEKRSKTVIRDFFVDNLRPINDIEIDIPIEFANVDTYIMGDRYLDRASNNLIKANRVNYNNDLRLFGLNAKVDYRDLFTYTYKAMVNDTYISGGSQPPATINYSSAGYNGTLSKTNQVDNGHSQNDRYRESYTSCHTEKTKVDSYCPCANDFMCYIGGAGCHWTGVYETKEVCSTSTRWVDNWNWYANWTGYYQGEVVKYVKQPYTDPFREISEKYLIYISNSSGLDLADYNAMLARAAFKTIFIGRESQRSQFGTIDLFIENDGTDINILVSKALDMIGAENETRSAYLVKPNQKFNLTSSQMDSEGDVINVLGYQYVQNQKYDNPTGKESNTRTTFSDTPGAYGNHVVDQFGNVGEYTIYRKVKDETGKVSFDKDSNLAKIVVDVKRPPVCDFDLDWTYNVSKAKYDTTWTDSAYDPDHQFSRVDKGIVDRNIMYRQSGGAWIYRIPENLSPGTYEVRYSVKDVDRWWSPVVTKFFTLNNIPPVQFRGQVRSEMDQFDLTSIPASENLLAYNMWTRYPYDECIDLLMLKAGTGVSQTIQLRNPQSKPTVKANGDLMWQDRAVTIPDVLGDGDYQFRFHSYDKDNVTNGVEKLVDFKVFTPIDLVGSVAPLNGGCDNLLMAETSKYVDQLTVTVFKGSHHECILTMNKTLESGQAGSGSSLNPGKSQWTATINPDQSIPEGDYTIEYRATTPSGKEEIQTYTIKLYQLRIVGVTIEGSWNHWRGQVDLFGKQMPDHNHRFMSLENIIVTGEILGEPDRVYIEMSPELEAMTYTDDNNNTYSYSEFSSKSPVFPLKLTHQSGIVWQLEYMLPLAKSTLGENNGRLEGSYFIELVAEKNGYTRRFLIDDIEITGNTFDQLYIQQRE